VKKKNPIHFQKKINKKMNEDERKEQFANFVHIFEQLQ